MSNPIRLNVAAIAVVLGALTACGPDTPAAPVPAAAASPSIAATSAGPAESQPVPDGGAQNQGGQPNQGQPNAGSTGQPPTQSSWPSPEDCVSYNPAGLTVKYESGAYTVTDGGKVVLRVPGQQGGSTGQQALALAQRFGRHCFIGRNNQRTEERGAYVFDYWRDPSGSNPSIVDLDELCSDYNRNNLTVEDMGSGHGWRVKDHDHVLHLFDNERDARNGKLVLAKYGRICSIGDNDDGQDVATFML